MALIIAVWQIRAAENIQREASAREAFKEYLKLAIDKPDFAVENLSLAKGKKSMTGNVRSPQTRSPHLAGASPMNIDWLTPYLALISVALLLASTALSQRTDRSLSEIEGNMEREIFLYQQWQELYVWTLLLGMVCVWLAINGRRKSE
ncbi:MAG: hypothetical protein QJT81_08475 [Candidatus Thiothrix putei]|uniref:Uncharacterized protein n=1 Tax=Candidatus Thiothrix putei TaxID=3080811 RepID=A0AA95KK11_9GAMM|nr:MAG: hypothetical protein QJT81_08475 [Candidatus Thiothrix putei]